MRNSIRNKDNKCKIEVKMEGWSNFITFTGGTDEVPSSKKNK